MADEANGRENGSLSPEERHERFLRDHEERMKRVDEALEEVRNAETRRAPEQERSAPA